MSVGTKKVPSGGSIVEKQGMCNYCGVGCSVIFHTDTATGKIVKVTGAPNYPVNEGIICIKGFKLPDYMASPDRGKAPLVRDARGVMKEASWDEAVKRFTDKVKEVQKNTPAGQAEKPIAFISTGQLFTEEFALLGMLRGIMDMEGDGNTRLCMASAVVGYKQAFGFDSPPFTYKDIEETDCAIFIGANSAISHPIVFNRLVSKNKRNPEIIVIDPRETDTAKRATFHIPITPKKDLLLLYTLANALIARGKAIKQDYIEKHTAGFADFKAFVAKFDPKDMEQKTGVPRAAFDRLVAAFETKERVSFWWTLGVNQSHEGVRTIQAMINICLMTGNIGRPGTGPNSMTGQSNAMGSRILSNTSSLFGGRDFANDQHRKDVCEILGVSDDALPKAPTKAYDKIIHDVEAGKIKILWIVGTNTMHSFLDAARVEKAFKKLELLVVQDLFPDTTTSKHADIFLPALTIGEKEGSTINSERRIAFSGQAKKGYANALSDYDIFLKIWKAYGKTQGIEKWATPADCFQLLKALSKGMPCDFSMVRDYAHLLEKQGVQWPYAHKEHDADNERRLFENGEFSTENKKAKFLFEDPAESAQPLSAEFPLRLLTGRGSIAQFQTATRTGRSEALNKSLDPKKPYFEISEEDAATYHIAEGDKVKIISKLDSFVAASKIKPGMRRGCLFLPFHFEGVNRVVVEEVDPYSREPSFKNTAVRLEKV